MTAETFLQQYLQDLAARERAETLAYWRAANSGRAEDFEAHARARLAWMQLHADARRYEQVQRWLAGAESLPPLVRRSLQVAERTFREHQVPEALLGRIVSASSEIEQIYTAFRGELDGQTRSNNELLEVLRREQDATRRRAAWEALKAVGAAVGPKLVRLARLRNEAARHLGFADFWHMRVQLEEHDPERLLALFEELETRTRAPFAQVKAEMDAELAERFGCASEALRPWHYDNPFFQAPPASAAVDLDPLYADRSPEDLVEIARNFYAQLGLPVDDILDRSDLFERPGKDQHAFCTHIDRAGDVRVLANLRPTAEWMDTLLHELGHGVYDQHLDLSLPFNLRAPAHIFTTEGVAMLFGALGKSAPWIVAYAGVDQERVSPLASAMAEQRRREQLVFARFTLVMLHFERAFYADPDQDLNRLWWELVSRFQGLHPPEDRDAPDWASKPHMTIAPVYYHNYMLGEFFAAQLRERLGRLPAAAAGDGDPAEALAWLGRPGVAEFLVERVFRPGMRDPWPEFVQAVVGAPLSAAAFAAEVGATPSP